jgi:hypothetical protein
MMAWVNSPQAEGRINHEDKLRDCSKIFLGKDREIEDRETTGNLVYFLEWRRYRNVFNWNKQQQEEDYQEYLDFKEKRDREKGILPEGYPIGDTLHERTVKSYAKLGLDTPDSVYYASRRPTERMLKMCKALAAEKGEKFEVTKTITRVYWLKDKNSGKEFMTWNEYLEFADRMDNIHTLDYSRCGVHPEAIGNVRRDIHMKVIGGEVTGIKQVFDKEWSTKAFEELMK